MLLPSGRAGRSNNLRLTKVWTCISHSNTVSEDTYTLKHTHITKTFCSSLGLKNVLATFPSENKKEDKDIHGKETRLPLEGVISCKSDYDAPSLAPSLSLSLAPALFPTPSFSRRARAGEEREHV